MKLFEYNHLFSQLFFLRNVFHIRKARLTFSKTCHCVEHELIIAMHSYTHIYTHTRDLVNLCTDYLNDNLTAFYFIFVAYTYPV